MPRTAWLLTAMALGFAARAGGVAQEPARADADRMLRKLSVIIERGEEADRPAEPLRTSFTEREVNAYFRYYGHEDFPAGVVDPQITIVDRERLTGRVVVDLDTIRRSQPRGWLDPLAYVSGALEVRVAGKVRAADGVGTLHIESASVGGMSVSRTVLQDLVSFFTRTAENPAGFQIDQPFELPARIRAVELRAGAATVVQ